MAEHARSFRPERQSGKKRLSFEVDPRVTLKIDFDLAIDIGEFILSSRPVPENPAIFAFAKRLSTLHRASAKYLPPDPGAERGTDDEPNDEGYEEEIGSAPAPMAARK